MEEMERARSAVEEMARLSQQNQGKEVAEELWQIQMSISDMFRGMWQRELRRINVMLIFCICSIIITIAVGVVLLEM